MASDPDDTDPLFNRFDYSELGFPFTPDAPAAPNVIDINEARRKRDKAEERRLEQKVIERWTRVKEDKSDG